MSKMNPPTNQNGLEALATKADTTQDKHGRASPKARPANTPAPRMVDPIAHLSPAEQRKLPANIIGGLRFMVTEEEARRMYPSLKVPSPPRAATGK